MKTKVEYEKKEMLNEDGRSYGTKYIITGTECDHFVDLQETLIEEVIGLDFYYGHRDGWEQIQITDGRKKKTGYHVTLDQKINLGMDWIIPRNCNLSDSQLETLGFEAGDGQDQYYRPVNPPEGWGAEEVEGGGYNFVIYDGEKNKRAKAFHPVLGHEHAEIEFLTRYSIEYTMRFVKGRGYGAVYAWVEDRLRPDAVRTIKGFGAEPDYSVPDEVFGTRDKSKSDYRYQAKLWLDENFPLWEDPTAYWGTDNG